MKSRHKSYKKMPPNGSQAHSHFNITSISYFLVHIGELIRTVKDYCVELLPHFSTL